METGKTYDEFIARQVQAMLAGETTVVRNRESLWGSVPPNDFWRVCNITSCWIFSSYGADCTEFWHVDEVNRVVVRVTR